MPPIFPSVPPAADDGLDFDAAITRQEQLCDALEALADSLPERIDTYAAMQLAGRIVPTLKRCQRLEERVISRHLLSMYLFLQYFQFCHYILSKILLNICSLS